MNLKQIASAAMIAAALTACAAPAATPAIQSSASDISVTGAWARPALGGMPAADATKDPNTTTASMDMGSMSIGAMSAAYMTLQNKGGEDTLVGVSGDVAEMIQVHRTIEKDGMMSMEEAKDGIPVPANGSVELKPGGIHIMMMNLKKDLKAGDTFKLTLKFKSGKELAVDVPVREP